MWDFHLKLLKIIDEKLKYLKNAGIETSAFEIKLLLADILGIELGEVAFYKNDLTEEQNIKLNNYIQKRENNNLV